MERSAEDVRFDRIGYLAGAALVVIGDALGLPYGLSALVAGGVCFGLRLMAIRFGWKLPGPKQMP